MTCTNETQANAFENAQQKFQSHGSLSLTAADCKAMGGIPSEQLFDNPDKTLLEVLNECDVEDFLDELNKILLAPLNGEEWFQYRRAVYDDFVKSMIFLKEHNRVPRKYNEHLRDLGFA